MDHKKHLENMKKIVNGEKWEDSSIMAVPYHQVPNSIFDDCENINITTNSLAVYIYLCRCSNQGSEAYPSYRDIAKKCRMTRPTAVKAVNELEAEGLVTVTRRRKTNKDNYSNIYTVNRIPGKGDLPGPSKGDLPPSKGDLPNKELPKKNFNQEKKISTGSFPTNQEKDFSCHSSSPQNNNNKTPTITFKEYLKLSHNDNETIEAINNFLREYEKTFAKEHMKLRGKTWQQVADTLLYVETEYNSHDSTLTAENIEEMAQHYFTKSYQEGCNYSITHFNNAGVKAKNFYEVVYGN